MTDGYGAHRLVAGVDHVDVEEQLRQVVGAEHAVAIETPLGIIRIERLTKDTRKIGVTVLPKKLDEEVARLHLAKIGVKLTVLSKDQADYIGVPVEGPYKTDHYRY